MKKFFVTAIAVIIAVLAIPAVKAFAADTALEDIPILGYSESGKAVKWYEEKSVYMECHYLFDDWED